MATRNSNRSGGPAPSTSRGLTRGTNARTAREGTEGASRSNTRTAAGVTRQTTRTRGTQPTGTAGGGKSLSLFDAVKKAGEKKDDDGGDVKATDIWNKFVSDDDGVVRAPTAQSGSEYMGSQVSVIEEGDDDGEEKEEEEDEEVEEEESSEDDDRTIYSDYYLPPAYERALGTPEIRAEIVDSHEACSCFPNRSSKFIGAMLYEKIQCEHSGLVGETQSGCFKFNPYWNENMEIPRRLRKRDLRIAKTKFVFGYPRPKFEIVSESEEEYDEDDDDGDEDEEGDSRRSERRDGSVFTPKTAKTKASERTRGGDDDDEGDSEYDSEYDDEDDEYDDESDDEDYVPFELPQIGYPQTPSLPPSSQSRRSVYSEYTESVPELPPIPGSRQLTAQTRRTGVTQRTQRSTKTAKTTKTEKTGKATVKSSKKGAKSVAGESVDSGYDENRSSRATTSRQSLPAGPVVSNSRTFQGKFYDPVTKQVMLYDIATQPGDRMPGGNMEPLNKPPTAQPTLPGKKADTPKQAQKAGSKPGSKASQRSKGSQASQGGGVGFKAAVLGNVFIQNLLSKNKQNKTVVDAKFSDEED